MTVQPWAETEDWPRTVMAGFCVAGIEYLKEVYSPELGLFPYRSLRSSSGEWENDFWLSGAVRYTINSLLGLQEAMQAGLMSAADFDTDAALERFLDKYAGTLTSPADRGLLLRLLADRDEHRSRASEVLQEIAGIIRSTPTGRLHMQDLAWMLWGSSAASAAGIEDAADTARRVFESLADHFVNRQTGLPNHSTLWYRRHIVSFGSLAYFLRALEEFAALTGDRRARELFRNGVERTLRLQGPRGEWPWLIDNRSGKILDRYPVYAVHQDSMALLFLFPAAERHGISAANAAIDRSLGWLRANNELGVTMISAEPFTAYRAIQRRDRWPRLQRYVRAMQSAVGSHEGWEAPVPPVCLNAECRPYHVGWILFVWSARCSPAGS